MARLVFGMNRSPDGSSPASLSRTTSVSIAPVTCWSGKSDERPWRSAAFPTAFIQSKPVAGSSDARQDEEMKESAEVAVGRLFEEHGARLYRLGVRFCGDADEAHDLVQDVFLQAFRRWKQFDGRSSPSTWLYTIAARRCQRRHRRRAGEPAAIMSLSSLPPSPHDPIVPIASDSNPFDDAVRQQLENRVTSAVAALPAQMRLPLVLAEIAEIPLADVARVLGLKLGTVKSRVHRARLAVRERIAAGVPSLPAPATEPDHRFCKDLLHAKQEALDRGVSLLVSDGDLCDHCKNLFATLDLSRDVCRSLAQGEIPPELSAVVDVAKSTKSRPPSRRARQRRAQR